MANWDNRINFMVFGLLVVTIGADISAPELTHHDGGVVAGVLLFVRYVIQVSRLCRLVADSKRQLELSRHQKVTLQEVVEEEHQDHQEGQ